MGADNMVCSCFFLKGNILKALYKKIKVSFDCKIMLIMS